MKENVSEMGINPLKWKIRNMVYIVLGIFLIYIFCFYKKIYQVIDEAVIKNSNPQHVWEYVADFSNMKKLNPAM